MCVHDIEMLSVIYSWCSLGIIIAGNFQSLLVSIFCILNLYFFLLFIFLIRAHGLYKPAS